MENSIQKNVLYLHALLDVSCTHCFKNVSARSGSHCVLILMTLHVLPSRFWVQHTKGTIARNAVEGTDYFRQPRALHLCLCKRAFACLTHRNTAAVAEK